MYRETLARYFLRLGLKMPDTLSATPELLRELQYAHCTHIPLENLDIIRHVPLSLEPGDLYKKVIDRHMGGCSLELSGLFAWFLRELGYGVEEYAARYMKGEKDYPPRLYRVLKVTANDGSVWCCEAGIGGDCPMYPVKLEESLEQSQPYGCYKFEKHRLLGWRLMEKQDGRWTDLYAFTEERQLPQDFLLPCFYLEHSPDSPLAGHEKFSMRTDMGKITLDGHTFREYAGSEVTEKECTEDEMPWAYSFFGLKY